MVHLVNKMYKSEGENTPPFANALMFPLKNSFAQKIKAEIESYFPFISLNGWNQMVNEEPMTIFSY